MSAGNDEAQTRAALDPGIEPWTLRKAPLCDCDAWGYMCDQGRRCPHGPAPAEAATDIGAGIDIDPADAVGRLMAAVARALAYALIACLLALVTATVVTSLP